jgi:WD40 repeat protein
VDRPFQPCQQPCGHCWKSRRHNPLPNGRYWYSYAITCLDWSTHSTLLSSSIDHTIKEWGIQPDSLNTFSFHCKPVSVLYLPQDNNFFVAAFEDFIIRSVYIPNKQVVFSYEIYEEIISMGISETGNVLAVGMNKGKVVPFTVREADLKLIDRPVLNARNKRGFKKGGKKVTGIFFLSDEELIVTTLDSNVRLFNLQDYQMKQKYKGAVLKSGGFRAETTHDKKFVVCGCESGKFLIWNCFLPMELKNKKYESVKISKKKVNEFVFAAPKVCIDVLNERSSASAFNYMFFCVDVFSILRIYIA